ncbi:hypothetical protein MPTK1_2g21980 [Marchantia polymorpha subsp. ruderalis]|uniref:Uncharacterized protein n=1 Tax=Marchantia polymorpha TaxID=3197 RepID=A0A2R6X2L1_MARPO|nr:hypothetical protein MARPO_0040s0017 [Marchantia polymorpha]BBN03245.1 hypothetical protein Mp_2g21980 [Marchantia polymorpha subsp. ruderalis]|eukprot:PTQ40332.1 hypothetical protein MARPO_0040s0017 [Marchantia polymorpha]
MCSSYRHSNARKCSRHDRRDSLLVGVRMRKFKHYFSSLVSTNKCYYHHSGLRTTVGIRRKRSEEEEVRESNR